MTTRDVRRAIQALADYLHDYRDIDEPLEQDLIDVERLAIVFLRTRGYHVKREE